MEQDSLDYEVILRRVKTDPTYQTNTLYGEARDGHPEGSVAAHIEQLTHNLDRVRSHVSSES